MSQSASYPVVPSEYTAVPDWYSDRSPHSNVIGCAGGSGCSAGAVVGSTDAALGGVVVVTGLVSARVVSALSVDEHPKQTSATAAMMTSDLLSTRASEPGRVRTQSVLDHRHIRLHIVRSAGSISPRVPSDKPVDALVYT